MLPAVDRQASTWPRGWMAAAVAQQVREFNAQVSRAQMTLQFLQRLEPLLAALQTMARRQQLWPAPAAQARLDLALEQLQTHWARRYPDTLGSLDECLQWSPWQRARRRFELAGWNAATLNASQPRDRELVSFSLLDQAHGAWLAEYGRSPNASRYALAAALAPLQIQLHADPQSLPMSVDERLWPRVLERLVVKGNGQRFPAGQWASPQLLANPQAVQIAAWAAKEPQDIEALMNLAHAASQQVAEVCRQLQDFQQEAAYSIASEEGAHWAQIIAWSQAFADAGQQPNYQWIQAVVPAVRAISRRRVVRLLKSMGALD